MSSGRNKTAHGLRADVSLDDWDMSSGRNAGAGEGDGG